MMAELLHLFHQLESLPWRRAMDELLLQRRPQFIFDNVALYRQQGDDLEVEYARAFGRGRSAEADAAWGETLAAEVLQRQERLLVAPPSASSTMDRLQQAHLLGLPLAVSQSRWVVVFARFGGPAFDDSALAQADETAALMRLVLMRRMLAEKENEAEALRHQLGMQEDFLSTISHQFRSPLGVIKGYVDSLLRPDVSWDASTRHRFLQGIAQEADRLTQLVENLLASSAWESKSIALNFQLLQIESLLRDAALRARFRYPKMEIYLSAVQTPPIWGDAVQLTQVLENLFSNVARHAAEAPVVIRLKTEENFVHLFFSDAGPGMSAEILGRLFQRFSRPTPTSGSGLGLYLCRRIVEAHGGKIWAESTPGRGTTIHILLPVARQGKTS
jgi:two-component system sensor histidine kinase KdpD